MNSDARGRLATELRQTKGFSSVEQEAALGLLRTADTIRRHYSEALSDHGITLQQYNVLRILRGAGEAGLPTLEIGERMLDRTPGVTRLVDRLVKKGLVERVVLMTHVLRNSLIPVVTVIALGVPQIFGGAIITEQIFRINGLGGLLIARRRRS